MLVNDSFLVPNLLDSVNLVAVACVHFVGICFAEIDQVCCSYVLHERASAICFPVDSCGIDLKISPTSSSTLLNVIGIVAESMSKTSKKFEAGCFIPNWDFPYCASIHNDMDFIQNTLSGFSLQYSMICCREII